MEPARVRFADGEVDILVHFLLEHEARFLLQFQLFTLLDTTHLVLIPFIDHLGVAQKTASCVILPDFVCTTKILAADHVEQFLMLIDACLALASMERLIVE